MKKVIYATLAVVMLAVLLTGCKVKTTVEPKYVDDFVNDYANETTVDDAGNVTYKFDNKKYDAFVVDYYEEVKEESRLEIKSSGQYSYYNPDITEIIVGVTPESYEELGEEALKEEAQKIGDAAMKYQMNTKNPTGEISVIYRNANTSEEYFEIIVKA